MSQAVATQSNGVLEALVLGGDLSKMTDTQKVIYYKQFCDSLGLNPLTQPFRLLKFQGREVMYATKDCTEQLRKIHGISVDSLSTEINAGVYIVIARVKDQNHKTDISTGVVPIEGMKGENLANAMMKAETKAKRRATLSICGLGMMDESEIETVDAKAVVSDFPKESKKTLAPELFAKACDRIHAGERDIIAKLRESYALSDDQRQVLLAFEDANTVTA
jgi:hypothetical protein